MDSRFVNPEADRAVQATMEEAAQTVRDRSAENHAIGGVCDFCGTPVSERPIGATYITEGLQIATLEGLDTETGGIGKTTFVNDPYWCACSDCDPVVMAGDPVKLAAYVVDNRHERVGVPRGPHDEEIRNDLVELYASFYALNPHRDPNFDSKTVYDAPGQPKRG